MAKKKDEKDVLIVRDEKTGEISVVAGLNADGTPKRTPAKAENGRVSCNSTGTETCWTTSSGTSSASARNPAVRFLPGLRQSRPNNLLEVMKELLKNPEAYSELLAPHKVDTSGYEQEVQKVQEEQQQQNKKNNNPIRKIKKIRKNLKSRRNGTETRTESGSPATDAGQTGLPAHRREQNQLAGAGRALGRETRRA